MNEKPSPSRWDDAQAAPEALGALLLYVVRNQAPFTVIRVRIRSIRGVENWNSTPCLSIRVPLAQRP